MATRDRRRLDRHRGLRRAGALLGAFLGGWGIAVALVAYFVVIALTGAKPGHSGF